MMDKARTESIISESIILYSEHFYMAGADVGQGRSEKKTTRKTIGQGTFLIRVNISELPGMNAILS
jgi:hypothetical protein